MRTVLKHLRKLGRCKMTKAHAKLLPSRSLDSIERLIDSSIFKEFKERPAASESHQDINPSEKIGPAEANLANEQDSEVQTVSPGVRHEQEESPKEFPDPKFTPILGLEETVATTETCALSCTLSDSTGNSLNEREGGQLTRTDSPSMLSSQEATVYEIRNVQVDKVDKSVEELHAMHSNIVCSDSNILKDYGQAREQKSIVSRKAIDHHKERSIIPPRPVPMTFRFATSRARSLFAKAGLRTQKEERDLWTSTDLLRSDTVCLIIFLVQFMMLDICQFRILWNLMTINCNLLLKRSV